MQDAFAYCAELVRAADKERFLASLFAPADKRPALHALYAFNVEVARAREAAREPLPGEIRLQWWRDVLLGERAGEASANPVASAILAVIERHHLASSTLIELVDARRFDLYNEPIATVSDLEVYAKKTSSAVIALAARILATAEMDAAADPAGIAYAVSGLLRAFPLHAARHQLYVPIELLERNAVRPEDIFERQRSAGLDAAIGELRKLARTNLRAARDPLTKLPPEVLPAFLAVALVRPSLDRMENGDPFSSPELSAWRRQWLIWRAARNPARIAA
jgi:phytoene synthase